MGPSFFFRAAVLASTVLAAGSATAGSRNFTGVWSDNASQGFRVGKLDITPTTVTVGRRVSYSVKVLQDNDTGAILQVLSSNRNRDPFGCGPEQRVTYLLLQPLAPTPGTTQQAMRLVFYGGARTPEMATFETTPWVCEIQPYGREPIRDGALAPSRPR